MRRKHTTAVLHWGVVWGGWRVPHPRCLRVGISVWNADAIEAVLRARSASFCDLQLLPAAAPARNSAGKEYVRQGALQSSARVWIPACGLCGHAQPCAFVDERAEKGHAVDGDADAQATGFAKDEEEGACELERAASTSVSQVCRGGAPVLAAEVLRFQRVHSQEEKRETGVHARQSGGARAREAPEGLAVEQFLFLREKRSRIGGDRCSGFVETPNQAEPMKKPRPPKPPTGHPKSSNDLRPGPPPHRS